MKAIPSPPMPRAVLGAPAAVVAAPAAAVSIAVATATVSSLPLLVDCCLCPRCYLWENIEISNIEEGRALNSWLIGL